MCALQKRLLYIFFFFFFFNIQFLFSEGLRFYGNDFPIDKRTSFNVFGGKAITFSDFYELKFNLQLYPTAEIGNIVRIKINSENLIFNLFYDGHGDKHLFLLNEEGRSNLMNIALDKSVYPAREWFTVNIRFDIKNKSISLNIEDQFEQVNNIILPDPSRPIIVFGKSDHIIDVPPFAIKNLSIGNSKNYQFLLDEYQGNITHDTRGRKIGQVNNPDWLINDSYHWNLEAEFKTETVSGTNYHEGRKEFYYFNRDSIVIFNSRTRTTKTILFNNLCPIDIKLGTNFIDEQNNKLYCYEVYYDSTYQGPTVASLDLNTYEWKIESYQRLPTQLHHHGSWFDPISQQYMIFGGFGNMRFSNQFYRYNINSGEWNAYSVNNKGGITPRYFTSMGYNNNNQSIYLFSGTGNVSGDQLLGREYFYDFYQLDLHTGTVTKEWEIPWYKDNAVPVRGMVINDNTYFYTLCYPEHFTESFLKLYRFSVENGDYIILGDSVPIFSDKINTNANLYYDKDLHSLYAVVHQFEDDIKSDLHIYSLAFPPITGKELANHPPTGKKNNNWTIFFVTAGIIVLGIGIFAFREDKNKKRESLSTDTLKTPAENSPTEGIPPIEQVHSKSVHVVQRQSRANSIYLFGEFTVYNREKRNITYMFSKKLKETFCLLLQFSQEEGGVSSTHLGRMLWPEKPIDGLKNIRNVTLNRLRKILEELDGIELLFEKGMFSISLHKPIYCDYSRSMILLSSNRSEANYKELVEIVTRGKFLENEDSPFYDLLKEKMEKLMEPLIIYTMEESANKNQWQTTIDLAQAVFHIDPMNEIALSYMIKALQELGMHENARLKYLSFLIEYKKVMGKDYPNSLEL